MKKITLFVAAVAVLASCNREDALATQSGSGAENGGNLNIRNFEKSELQNMITPMSQSFGTNGKAAATQLNYTYRAWAEPVVLDLEESDLELPVGIDHDEASIFLSASAAWAVNDMVFVVWHAAQPAINPQQNDGVHNMNHPGPLVGGSITAYKQSGIGQYEFMDRVDFFDADYHEVYGDLNKDDKNIEIMMVGQRSTITSKYVLAGHDGAVVTRIDYDYLNDEFWEGSIKELPLPGVSANDVVGAARRFYITTGGAMAGEFTGGVYEVDRNLNNVNKKVDLGADFSGRSLAVDPTADPNEDQLFVFSAKDDGTARINQGTITWNASSSSTNFSTLGSLTEKNINLPNLYERGDLTIATSPNYSGGAIGLSAKRVFFTAHKVLGQPLNSSSLYTSEITGGIDFVEIPVGNALSTEYDPSLDVLYVAMGGSTDPNRSAVRVIALEEYAKISAVVNEYDVVGEFADPDLMNMDVSWAHTHTGGHTGVTFSPTIDDIKEVTVYGSRNIALAAGSQGVYFIQRDN